MEYEIVNLFGPNKSRGTFDDFFDTDKYESIEAAWAAKDYVQGNFVMDSDGVLHIEAMNVARPDVKKHHKLEIQHPFAGLDVLDDNHGTTMANTLL